MPGPILFALSVDSCFPVISQNAAKYPRVKEPVCIDGGQPAETWNVPLRTFQGVFMINILHVVSVRWDTLKIEQFRRSTYTEQWKVVESIFEGISKVLCKGAHAFIYGPITINGAFKGKYDQAFTDRLKEEYAPQSLKF